MRKHEKILESIHPDDDQHYQKMGLKRNIVEIWEDGMRTDGSKGIYEWWYYDSHFPDGTILVIIFFSKSPIEVNGPIKPQATMELTLPDGTKYSEAIQASIEESSYATDRGDVVIGGSRITGDLKHYDIIFQGETMSARVSLDNTIPAWRSQTGSILFGDLLSGPVKLSAKLIGFDGGYLRFEGIATIEKLENGQVVESVSEQAVWELMYFGKSGADKEK